jgi:hypothetical protein
VLQLAKEMIEDGKECPSIEVVEDREGIVSLDNRRLLAAKITQFVRGREMWIHTKRKKIRRQKRKK